MTDPHALEAFAAVTRVARDARAPRTASTTIGAVRVARLSTGSWSVTGLSRETRVVADLPAAVRELAAALREQAASVVLAQTLQEGWASLIAGALMGGGGA